jgi:hypothetical protein
MAAAALDAAMLVSANYVVTAGPLTAGTISAEALRTVVTAAPQFIPARDLQASGTLGG